MATASAAVLVVSALFAERQPYERYQSVVDRQMFGQPPPGFDPTKSPSEVSAKDERAKEQELTQEQAQVKSAIHFSMVNVTPAGETAVGFTDNSNPKTPVHYYLKVGESRDGWTVKEADALKATMTIAKGEVEVSLELGGNSAGGAGTTARAGGGASRPGGLNAFGGRPGMLGNRMGGVGGASRGLGSLRERRALREQQRAEDAKAAAEKEAQREQERMAEKARQEQEKAQRDQEREEQRAQLMQIQEELRKAREERAKAEEAQKAEEAPKEGNTES